MNGHWTLQLKNDGNFEGETPNPTGTVFGDYPEMLSLARSLPEGHLDDFQRSKVRIWADYQAAWDGTARSVAPIYRYNSARTYSLVTNGEAAERGPGCTQSWLCRHADAAGVLRRARIGVVQGIRAARSRGHLRVPVWRTAQPWIKFESFNLLNNQKLIAWDTPSRPIRRARSTSSGCRLVT